MKDWQVYLLLGNLWIMLAVSLIGANRFVLAISMGVFYILIATVALASIIMGD